MKTELEALVEPVRRISRDMVKAMRQSGGGITDTEARFFVDLYYAMQEQRVRINNQVKGLDRDASKSGNVAEPHDGLSWTLIQFETLENSVKKMLEIYSESHPMSWFFDQTVGIGPVLAAGLMAHIDIHQAPTVGHIWNFAGLNPDVTWDKGQKRPWNTPLKTLCWKIGESFVKVVNKPGAFYGKVYADRKAREWELNLNGAFADQAARKLDTTKIGKTTDAFQWYAGKVDPQKVRDAFENDPTLPVVTKLIGDAGIPMLPPAHIQSRAKRYAVKLFLSHLHECWYSQEVGVPAKPFAIAIQGHAHYIAPPQRSPR